MSNDIKEIKIGMYTTDEILEFMTDGEGRGFMGRSMYDAILDYITNLEQENERLKEENKLNEEDKKWFIEKTAQAEVDSKYKSRNEKANALLDEMLERAYIDGEYIMYDYSTSELLEVKQALEG